MNEETVRRWIRKAENDLKIGKDEMNTEDPATDAVCFHMEQCVEKYLKAYLIAHGKEYPRTHNLERLVHLCAEIQGDFLDSQKVVFSNSQPMPRLCVMARNFTRLPLRKRAISLTEKVREFVRKRLQDEGFSLWD